MHNACWHTCKGFPSYREMLVRAFRELKRALWEPEGALFALWEHVRANNCLYATLCLCARNPVKADLCSLTLGVCVPSCSCRVVFFDNGRQQWVTYRGKGKSIPSGGTLVIGREQVSTPGCNINTCVGEGYSPQHAQIWFPMFEKQVAAY